MRCRRRLRGWHCNLGQLGRWNHRLMHLWRWNAGRGHGRVWSGHWNCSWRCEGTLPDRNLHRNRADADLDRCPRRGGPSHRHAWRGGGGSRWRRCGWWRDVHIMNRAGAGARRQDRRRHDGGSRGPEGFGRWRHRCLRHVDGQRHGHGRWRGWVHVWRRNGLGRRRSPGLELGPASQAELVEILVFLAATRTGDHERPSARIVGVSLVMERFFPR
jgi:hypothetical protein